MTNDKHDTVGFEGLSHRISSILHKLNDFPTAPNRFQVIYYACSSVAFGLVGGGLALSLMVWLQKIAPVEGTIYYFAMVGLSSFVAGIASGWYRRWTRQPNDQLFSLIAACSWFAILTGCFWHAIGWHSIRSVWPLVILDIVVVLFARINGRLKSQDK